MDVRREAGDDDPAVYSRHHLLEVRPDGNRRLYRWRREGLRDAASFLEEMWSGSLARLKMAAEREEWPERTRARKDKR